jgi:SAM-dependent methyltransferase
MTKTRAAKKKKKATSDRRRLQRRLSGPRRALPETPDCVGEFLAEAGLRNRLSVKEYWADIDRRFPEYYTAMSRAQEKYDKGNVDPYYVAKNSSLAFSLATTSQDWGDRIEKYLSWFAEADLPAPQRIFDVGCHNGITTCFYARHFPDAEVVGIDRCAKAIECARELAAQLELSNVQFHHADVADLPAHLTERPYDLVISTFVAGNISEPPSESFGTTEDYMSTQTDPHLASYAMALSALLPDHGGTLLSVDGIVNSASFASWALALRDSGIEIDWINCGCLRVDAGAEESRQSLPVLFGSKKNDASCHPGDVRALLMDCEMRDRDEPAKLQGTVAEAVFRSLQPKDFVEGVHVTFESGARIQREIWECQDIAMIYTRSVNSRQFLTIYSRRATQDMLEGLDGMPEDERVVDCERYHSPRNIVEEGDSRDDRS